MGLLGDSFDDPQTMATLALAGGLMGGRTFGQGLLGGVQGYQTMMAGAQDQKTKKAISDAQIANYQSEIQARSLASIKDQRQQALVESFFPGMYGGNQSQGSAGGSPNAAQATMSPGAYAPLSDGNGPVMPRPAAPQNDMLSIARGYGIPEQAIQSDMVFNGGKGISAMLEKHGAKDMQVTNGYAYDKNKVGAGFMPSITTTANGPTTMTQIGPDGMPIISAPNGALTTYGQYKGMDAGLAAAGKINLRKNADGTEAPVSELTENPTLQNMLSGRPGIAAPTGAPAGYANEPQMKTSVSSMGGEASSNLASIQREIKATQNDLMKPLDPASKSMLQAHLSDLQNQAKDPRNVAASPASTAIGAPAYGMTNQQTAQAKSASQFGEKLATDQAEILGKGYTGANDASNDLLGVYQARKAIADGAYQGSGADLKLSVTKFAGSMGITLKADQATNTDYLKSVLGQGLLEKAKTLGSNPSNADASRISDIVGSIGKDPQAMSKILDWREEMANRSISQHNTRVEQATKSGYQSPYDMRVDVPAGGKAQAGAKTVVKTGMYGGKKVVQYSDGSTAYAN